MTVVYVLPVAVSTTKKMGTVRPMKMSGGLMVISVAKVVEIVKKVALELTSLSVVGLLRYFDRLITVFASAGTVIVGIGDAEVVEVAGAEEVDGPTTVTMTGTRYGRPVLAEVTVKTMGKVSPTKIAGGSKVA